MSVFCPPSAILTTIQNINCFSNNLNTLCIFEELYYFHKFCTAWLDAVSSKISINPLTHILSYLEGHTVKKIDRKAFTRKISSLKKLLKCHVLYTFTHS